jgi:Cyclic nucleotide-binding domain/Zinc knuckle
MLNDNLRIETTVHLNGKLLNETPLFKTFDVAFLAQLTFVIKKRIFVIDEHIFNEGDRGESLFYIQKGTVILIHRKTRTFIKELGGDDFMGECAFFSGEPRSASARSKNFTDVIVLNKNDFISTTDEFPKAYQTLLDIQNKIKFKRDYSQIGVKCYICDRLGHISVECPQFYTWQGNQDMLTSSHDGKLIVKKSHDSYGHKMPKVTRNLPSLAKQFKEDVPFEIHHFDDFDR